jgi:hypothetical protein
MKNNAGGHGNGGHRMQKGMTLGFNDTDTDTDGAVSEAEFLAIAGPWIAMVDHNGDGEVTVADFGPQNN